MGLLSNIKNARGTRGGIYFKPGLYDVTISRVRTGKTRAGDDFFVVEANVDTSTCEEIPAGASCSWMGLLKHDSTLGNIADFCRAGLFEYAKQNGKDPGVKSFDDIELDEATVENAIAGDDNILAGIKMKVEAYSIQTKAGKDFTKVAFLPL